ncbi:MAG: hypothetical protein OER56_14860 [Hyphomicrobiales bacterium]|nr:hypothetical protein [Hyphomicrobiales bacterium]
MVGMMLPIRSILVCTLLAQQGTLSLLSADEQCANKTSVARQVSDIAKLQGVEKPEFRVTEQEDGQALLYWRHGMDSRSFYAVTFRPDGCAVLTDAGRPRRFVFPRSAYNTGVFEEMAAFDGRM